MIVDRVTPGDTSDLFMMINIDTGMFKSTRPYSCSGDWIDTFVGDRLHCLYAVLNSEFSSFKLLFRLDQ